MQAEAKDAFKELLASVSCGGEWTWEQAMRLIVNDGRYGALKSLGEKKQCFNEYVQQRRNEEKDEERRKTRQVCGLVVCGLGCVVCGLWIRVCGLWFRSGGRGRRGRCVGLVCVGGGAGALWPVV